MAFMLVKYARNFSSVNTPLDTATEIVNNNLSSINIRNKQGQSAINWAATNHSHNLVYALLKAGAEDVTNALSSAQNLNNGSVTDQYIINILQNRVAVAEVEAKKRNIDVLTAEVAAAEAFAAKALANRDAEAKQRVIDDAAAAEADKQRVIDAKAAAQRATAEADAAKDAAAAAILADSNLAPYNANASGPSASGPSASGPSASGGARKYKSRKSKRSRKLKRKTRR